MEDFYMSLINIKWFLQPVRRCTNGCLSMWG